MAHLSLALLGPLRIVLDGQPVSGFAYNKARALLAYLVVEGERPHHRDALVGLLWPELPDAAARTNLRQALANLREVLGDATPPFLLTTRDSIQFNPASDHDLDVNAFRGLLEACEKHPHRHPKRCRSCAARLAQALNLYRGDFLAEFSVGDSAPFEEWQLRQREWIHQRAMTALTQQANYYEHCGTFERARQSAQRLIELDPWNERAYRQSMRLLARDGQRNAAIAQYETCRRVLERELAVEPEAETSRLYQQIRDQASNHTENAQLTPRLNFPAPTAQLVGRDTELTELGAMLENPAYRMITITGSGGMGKTRLALAAATEYAAAYTDGAAFVPLQGLSSAIFLAQEMLVALSIQLQGQRAPRDQLLDYLRDRELLLVLDNLEQFLGADTCDVDEVAELFSAILTGAPRVTLLSTSRMRLGLAAEWLFDLSGLEYPSNEVVEALERWSAVQLFVQRARQVRRHFALVNGDARAVTQICRTVEGMPLAIELTAAALHTQSPPEVAAALQAHAAELTSSLRGVPERHRSIWATFEYSWRLLTGEEQQVFAQLSVFRGGIDAIAAAEIAQASSPLLAALVDKSLLRWDGASRYTLHDLLRQFAAEKLDLVGLTAEAKRSHASYFLTIARQSEHKLRGPEQQQWRRLLTDEHDNLGAGLDWSLESAELELGLQLAGALWWFWTTTDHQGEGRYWLSRLLEAAIGQDIEGPTLSRALSAAADLANKQDDVSTAERLARESLKLARELGDKPSIALASSRLGLSVLSQDDTVQAVSLFSHSLSLSRELKDTWGIAQSLVNLGSALLSQGAYSQAVACFEEALQVWHAAGDMRGCGFAVLKLSAAAQYQGDYEQARIFAEQSVGVFRELDERMMVADSCIDLAKIVQLQGDNSAAIRLIEESLSLYQQLGSRAPRVLAFIQLAYVRMAQGDNERAGRAWAQGLQLAHEFGLRDAIAEVFDGIAELARRQQQPVRAAQLLGAAAALRESIGQELPPGVRPGIDRTKAPLANQLGVTSFAQAYAAGHAMTTEQAIAYALEGNR